MAISYVSNALGGTTTTTSFSITLPATQANDILILEFTHRGTGNGTIGGTSGLSWTLKHSQLYASSAFSGKTYWARATGNHSGQTVTGSGLTNSCAAIVTVYRGALASGDPLAAATVVGEQNASGNETQAEISTTVANAWVVLVVVNSPDLAVSTQACTTPGTLTERAERLSTGGIDTSISHASEVKSTTGGTGAFTWAQTNGISGSWAYAIEPAIVSSISPSVSPSISASPSISPSVSESPSVSPSVSASPSISPSVSVSPSVSASPSISPSVSASPSVSPSVSESSSLSPSVSESPSVSPSVSESPSLSPSVSPSAPPAPSINLSLILVHNKGSQGNFDQIETIKSLITLITETQQDPEGNFFDVYHYEINTFSTPHSLKVYQVFPFGVTPPSNSNDITSHKVFYGVGDEDKIGDHSRFFNWGLKRGTDYQTEVMIFVDDASGIDLVALEGDINRLHDPQDSLKIMDNPNCKAVSKIILTEVGQLDESMNLTDAFADLVNRSALRGITNG